MTGYEGKSDRDLLIELHTTVTTIPPRLTDLEAVTAEHEKQINFWRGAVAVMGFLMLALGGTLLLHLMGSAH